MKLYVIFFNKADIHNKIQLTLIKSTKVLSKVARGIPFADTIKSKNDTKPIIVRR